jgi:hypothetical protein
MAKELTNGKSKSLREQRVSKADHLLKLCFNKDERIEYFTSVKG